MSQARMSNAPASNDTAPGHEPGSTPCRLPAVPAAQPPDRHDSDAQAAQLFTAVGKPCARLVLGAGVERILHHRSRATGVRAGGVGEREVLDSALTRAAETATAGTAPWNVTDE